ncbi:MAG: hypothetical protein ACFFE8_06985 [Candidatus Heimdallarchaeota archaeon]
MGSIEDKSVNSGTWNEDQRKLLKYSLSNIMATYADEPRYRSKRYFLATPFHEASGYQQFDVESNSLEEMLFKATEILKTNDFTSLNLETEEGIPILRVQLRKAEERYTVIVHDIVTDLKVCSILL